MSKRVEIPIGLQTTEVRKGATDAEKALRDLEDAVEDTGKGGAKDLDRLEDELKDVQRQSERTERSMEDIGDSGGRGLGKIKEGAQEVQQEIGQNLGEAVSSVRGDLSELGQVGQDTLGGLAATLASTGPAGIVGAAALAAGAVGLGMVTAGLEEAQERQERLKESAAEWAQAYVDAGGKIVSAAHVVSEVQAIATDPERYETAKNNARDWGIDVSTAMRAMAGDATALEVVQGSLNEKQREWNEIAEQASFDSSSSYYRETTAAQRELHDELQRGKESFKEQNEAMRLGREQYRNAAKALYEYTASVGEATGETDELGNAIYRLPDNTEVVVDANTKQAHADIDALEKRHLADKTMNVNVDTSRANAAFDALQRRANRGIDIAFNRTGRQLLE